MNRSTPPRVMLAALKRIGHLAAGDRVPFASKRERNVAALVVSRIVSLRNEGKSPEECADVGRRLALALITQ